MIAQRAVRGAVFILAGSYLNMAFGIVYGIVMARVLDPEHFGIFALALFFFSLFDLRSKLGLDYAFIHRQPTTDALLTTHWTLQFLCALVTLALAAAFSTIATRFNYPSVIAPVMLALASVMIVEALGSTARAALEKELAFARPTAVISGALFLSYLLAVLAALAGFKYWALVVQVAVNTGLSALGFWWVFRMRQRTFFHLQFDRALAGWMLRYGIVLGMGAIATTVLLQFDNFLVGTFVGAAALGFYAQAYKVAQWPTGLVTHIVSRAALPTYAKLQDDPPRLAKAFEMTLWLILTLATPLALALFVSAPDFLRLLYGDRWLPSAILLRALLGYSILRPLLDDTGALFTAIGKPRQITLGLIVQAVTLVALGTPLTLGYNAFGTAIAVGIAFVIGIMIMYRFVSRALPIQLGRLFAPTILSALGSVALYYLFANFMPLNSLPLAAAVLLKGGFAVLAFFAILLIFERASMFQRIAYVSRLLRGNVP